MGETEKNEVVCPHDLLVRNVLADTDLTADLLRNYLDPELVSTLDLKSLKREAGETVSPNLSERMGDLRYSGRFKISGKELKAFFSWNINRRLTASWRSGWSGTSTPPTSKCSPH